MRPVADNERIGRFMNALGRAAAEEGCAFLVGGATAVLYGWRATTVDVDVCFVPEQESLLRAIPQIKEELQVNVELASPADFMPVPAGWQERSIFVTREGSLSFFHYDPYAQALAKLERAHARDLEDVASMIDTGLVDPAQALTYFDEIEPVLYRFPAIDPRAFRRRVEEAFGGGGTDPAPSGT